MTRKNDPSPLPTLREINIHDSLDERCAAGHFLGKSLTQAEKMFREKFLHYQEDLMWMGPKAFCFYVDAAIAYVVSEAADGDPDAVNCFCIVIELQLKFHRAGIAPSFERLRNAAQAILQRFDRYDCDPQIYGDLESRYQNLLTQLTE